jgi:hypothetical protein
MAPAHGCHPRTPQWTHRRREHQDQAAQAADIRTSRHRPPAPPHPPRITTPLKVRQSQMFDSPPLAVPVAACGRIRTRLRHGRLRIGWSRVEVRPWGHMRRARAREICWRTLLCRAALSPLAGLTAGCGELARTTGLGDFVRVAVSWSAAELAAFQRVLDRRGGGDTELIRSATTSAPRLGPPPPGGRTSSRCRSPGTWRATSTSWRRCPIRSGRTPTTACGVPSCRPACATRCRSSSRTRRWSGTGGRCSRRTVWCRRVPGRTGWS